jgi:hypothetical protein
MIHSCSGRDEALLLLAHGQLGFWPAVALKFHARNCPQCRARLERYGKLSNALATVMAAPGGPRWIPWNAFKGLTPRGAFVSLLIMAILLSLWSLKSSAFASEPSPPATTAAAKITEAKACVPTSKAEMLRKLGLNPKKER